jgi:L-alanine-DL-glutamate epimerase-like enolase superfamily enzyme
MLDANNAWSDLATALRFARAYEPFEPYWLEEPFSPDDIESHIRLAERTSISIATGEIEAGRWRYAALLASGTIPVLQPDACVCGGITEFKRIAAMSSAAGAILAPHWFHDLHAHLVAATPNARWLEFFPDDQVLNFRCLIDRQLTVRSGRAILPDRPGLGFELDEDAVDRYALEGWSSAAVLPEGVFVG